MAGTSEGTRKGWEKRKAGNMHVNGRMLSAKAIEREKEYISQLNAKSGSNGFASGIKLSLQSIDEEYVEALKTLEKRVAIFDRMGNDASVKGILSGNIYPLISSCRVSVEGGEKEHQELVSANILRKGNRDFWCSTPFEQRLFEQGQQLKYGFMAFGKTRAIVDSTMIFSSLKFLHPRSFRGTIGPWEFSEDGASLVAAHRSYMLPSGEPIQDERVAIEDLFLCVWEMCGDNWEGKAMIRSAYKNWSMKELAEKIGIIHLQNVGVGIPQGKLGPGGGKQSADNMLSILLSMRGGSVERRATLLNDGEDVKWLTAEAGSDLSTPLVDLHARSIASSGTMQFLGDGNTESGSRASGSVHMVAYLQAVEAVKVIHQEQLNHGWGEQLGLVEDLIYSNYDNVEECPQIVFSPISPATQLENAQLIGDLIQKGAMSKDLGAENYVRKSLGMPDISAEDFQRIQDMNKPVPQIGGRPNEVGDTDREDPRNDKLGRAVGLKGDECRTGENLPPKSRPVYPWQKSLTA